MERFSGKKRFWVIPMFLVAMAGFSVIAMLLWNALLPAIFNIHTITFWQAAGLLILSRLFFGFNMPWGGRHNHRRDFREKWENMNPEQREEFKQRIHQRRHFWGEHKENAPKQDNSENTNS